MRDVAKAPRSWEGSPGHSVLQVPVPALEGFVRARTAHYDMGFVCDDPGYVHAHVTALGPFVAEPTDEDLAVVARIAADTPAFEVVLGEVAAFPDGIIHLVPEPEAGFRALTARLCAAFPDHPPYGGRYGPPDAVVPHLTLDVTSPDVDIASTRRLLGGAVPVVVRARRLDLVWYETGRCRLMRSWALGGHTTG
ncbi:2'-5' RNA ligase family protein [Nocardioides sp.]|uniref:2'-5' RNA ligase family protein n=2 Tax=Nocardioides sp. TaxID=35761 RepID=UPI003219F936